MKKIPIILFAVLVIGVIIFTVIANIEPSESEENISGDTQNATKVEDKILNSNIIYFPFGKSYAKENSFTNYDYITVDFDICPYGINDNYLAGGMKFSISYREDGADDTGLANFYLLEGDDGNFYLGTKSSEANTSNEARLFGSRGVYDHLTFICQVDKTEASLSSITTYAYVNGKYVAKTTKELTKDCVFTRFFIGKARDTGAFPDGYGISHKNFVGYTYNTGSEKALALKTIIDTGKPFYNDSTEVLVYNSNYKTPDGNNSYVKINDEKYTLIGRTMDRLTSLANDDVITVSGRRLNGVTIPDGVESFTVKLLNNGFFSLSDESDALYVQDGELYRYQKKNISVTDDCSTSKFGSSHVLNGEKGGSSTSSLGFAHSNLAKSTNIRVTYVNSSYVRIHYNSASDLKEALAGDTSVTAYSHMEREAELAWRAYSTYNEKTDLKNMRYLTLDFDFGTDAYAYIYQKNGNTEYVTAKDDEEFTKKTGLAEYESRDLAFPLSADGTLKLTPVFLSSKTADAPSATLSTYTSNANWELKNLCTLAVTKSKGEWYIKPNVSGTNSAKLSGEVGAFDHITFVFEIENNEDKTIVYPHVYINGEHLASLSAVEETENAKYNHFHQLKINFGSDLRENKSSSDQTLDTPSYKMFDRYSLAFDNMALTYYDSEDLERTTLDELLDEKKPLYEMVGTVYGDNYKTQDSKDDEEDS